MQVNEVFAALSYRGLRKEYVEREMDTKKEISRYTRPQHILSVNKQSIYQVQKFEYKDGSGDLVFSCMPVYRGIYGSGEGRKGTQCSFKYIPNVRLAEEKLLGIIR
jgi:hypothetical protein